MTSLRPFSFSAYRVNLPKLNLKFLEMNWEATKLLEENFVQPANFAVQNNTNLEEELEWSDYSILKDVNQ